jgi:RNA polymerase sigma factor (sigma-70 family)
VIGDNPDKETNYIRDERRLRRYTATGSEQAFAEILREHMPFVYATCLRELSDPSLAQDAAQVVFIVLARKAAHIRNGRALVSWLFRTACLTARDMSKQERRRQAGEQQLIREIMHQETEQGDWDRALWNRLDPSLNDALRSLGRIEQECVLLHYFVGYNLREIGESLHISEEAARKRTTRALEKMRRFLSRQDATITTVALAGLLAGYRANALPPLPAPLQPASIFSSDPIRGFTTQMHLGQCAKGVLKTMKLAKITAFVGITTTVGLAVGGIGLACMAALTPRFNRNQKPPTAPAVTTVALPVPTPQQNNDIPTKSRQMKKNKKDDAEMVLIPAGKFTMGSTQAEVDALDQQMSDDFFKSESPQHEVTLSTYYIYRTPVTVGQYMKFCEETGHEKPAAPDFNPNWSKQDHPIVNISYTDARAYCKWASGSNPGSVRLPTEAEWERAARGGQVGSKYPWGNEFDTSKLWCSKQTEDDAGGTRAVGSFAPNGYGLYDMVGNVWQWCSDWFDAGFYSNPLATKLNPDNQSSGEQKARVLRGGSWGDTNPIVFRCAGRIYDAPNLHDAPPGRGNHFGFRCVSGVAAKY